MVPTCHEAWAVQFQPREAQPASAGVQVGRGGSEDPLEARGFPGTRGRTGSSDPAPAAAVFSPLRETPQSPVSVCFVWAPLGNLTSFLSKL